MEAEAKGVRSNSLKILSIGNLNDSSIMLTATSPGKGGGPDPVIWPVHRINHPVTSHAE